MAAAPESIERYRTKYRLLDLRPGESVLDVGCGAGADLFRIAREVGATGRSVGIDLNPEMIASVRQRIAAEGFIGVEAQVAEDGPLPFADDMFDVVHAERVLVHVTDPERMVKEMVRVLKAGGRIVCCEGDYGTRNILDIDDMDLFERVYGAKGAGPRHQYMGRQLFRRFARAGLSNIDVVTVPVQQYSGNMSDHAVQAREQQLNADLRLLLESRRITAADAERFRSAVKARIDAGEYFSVTVSMVARGTKDA